MSEKRNPPNKKLRIVILFFYLVLVVFSVFFSIYLCEILFANYIFDSTFGVMQGVFYCYSWIYCSFFAHWASGFKPDPSQDEYYYEVKIDFDSNTVSDPQLCCKNEHTSSHIFNVIFLGLVCALTQPVSTFIVGCILFVKLGLNKPITAFLIILNILFFAIAPIYVVVGNNTKTYPAYVNIQSTGSCEHKILHDTHYVQLTVAHYNKVDGEYVYENTEVLKITFSKSYVKLSLQEGDQITVSNYSSYYHNCSFDSDKTDSSVIPNVGYTLGKGETLNLYFKLS